MCENLSPGSVDTLTGLYQVISSQRGVRWTGNFRFSLNERDSEQRGRRSKSTIWTDSSPHLACPLNRKLMKLIRLVTWNSPSFPPHGHEWKHTHTDTHTQPLNTSPDTAAPHALCIACLHTGITSEELTGRQPALSHIEAALSKRSLSQIGILSLLHFHIPLYIFVSAISESFNILNLNERFRSDWSPFLFRWIWFNSGLNWRGSF